MLSERPSADNSSWWVPLTFTSDFGEIYTGWMFGDEEGMELVINATSQQWVIFNVNQVGESSILDFDIYKTIFEKKGPGGRVVSAAN